MKLTIALCVVGAIIGAAFAIGVHVGRSERVAECAPGYVMSKRTKDGLTCWYRVEHHKALTRKEAV